MRRRRTTAAAAASTDAAAAGLPRIHFVLAEDEDTPPRPIHPLYRCALAQAVALHSEHEVTLWRTHAHASAGGGGKWTRLGPTTLANPLRFGPNRPDPSRFDPI